MLLEVLLLVIKILLHFVHTPYESEESVIFSVLMLAFLCGLYLLTIRAQSLVHFIGFILLFIQCVFELVLMVKV